MKVSKKESMDFFQIQKDKPVGAGPRIFKPSKSKKDKMRKTKSIRDALKGERSEELFGEKGPSASLEGAGKNDECAICLDTVKNARSLKCKHVFCTSCVEIALHYDNRCPVCKDLQWVVQGNQPIGEMQVQKLRQSLPGYKGFGTILITYYFPPGTQGPEHPNPGQRYFGTDRSAYLPDNQEGREVLALLKRAFDSRLVFTVGRSVSSGLSNQITWNDIHHKTNIYGGPEGYGYPDPDYLRRVKEDLAAKGIR